MLKTVEMRWFFKELPKEVARHWQEGAQGQERSDWYSMPCQPNCGIKIREGALETKLRYACFGERSLGTITGRLEGWKKWSLAFPPGELPQGEELRAAGWLEVVKRRVLYLFEVRGGEVHATATRPANGCSFEVTRLRVAEREHWTVGLEAIGPTEAALEDNLRLVAQACLPQDEAVRRFQAAASQGYAEWLSREAERVSQGCP